MIVYRLSKEQYKNDLSGKGAEKAGGRWNSKGVAVLYTSTSRVLCTAEIAVHTPLGVVPKDYYLVTLEFPVSDPIHTIEINNLPTDWKSFPYLHATQEIGDRFIAESRFLVMQVPSAVIQGDYNYLINPSHQFFCRLRLSVQSPMDLMNDCL
ncbi:MAG: RES family NAD+ phosphorylase [Bacteroidota bacterium]|nr:RES family NAD+ phosphorylase [Bacteroidota bacterium]